MIENIFINHDETNNFLDLYFFIFNAKIKVTYTIENNKNKPYKLVKFSFEYNNSKSNCFKLETL